VGISASEPLVHELAELVPVRRLNKSRLSNFFPFGIHGLIVLRYHRLRYPEHDSDLTIGYATTIGVHVFNSQEHFLPKTFCRPELIVVVRFGE
jgi:hypothetical protein